jgi:hypothetical protein
VLTFLARWLVLAGAVTGQRMREMRTTAGAPLLLGQMDALVAFQKGLTQPGDIQVVIPGRYDMGQWYKAQQYYARYDDGLRGLRTPEDSDTLLEPPPPAGMASAARGLSRPSPPGRRPVPGHVQPRAPRRQDGEGGQLARPGWCGTGASASWHLTGKITYLRRCAGRSRPPTATAR